MRRSRITERGDGRRAAREVEGLTTRFRVVPVLLLLLSTLARFTPIALAQHEEDRERIALGVETPPLLALPLSEAPGATTLITAEEIARSAAANIFELLQIGRASCRERV